MRIVLPALALLLFAAPAEATRRHALVIGANVGGPRHEPLRYAEADAARMAAVLRDVGGFAPGDVVLLTRVDARAVRETLIELNARIREDSGPTMLFVYYSGHGDARALHLYGTELELRELRNLVAGSPARSRVLVVDACQSGAITRVKGGTPIPEFDIAFEQGDAEGLAILTSSAASEDAQESDELGASIFTHHLVSALLGAADRDSDGLVTLNEAFSYSAERTLAASSSTRVGPQHPTYRLDLGGHTDLVLSRPASARNMGLLVLPNAGTWIVRDTSPRKAVVAEVVANEPGVRIALRPGRYGLLRRDRKHLLEGDVRVVDRQTTAVDRDKLRRIDYAQAVRKGGTERRHSFALQALRVFRTSILDLGSADGVGAGLRIDYPVLSLEARILHFRSQAENFRLAIETEETAILGLFTHSFDAGAFTFGVGLESGFVFFGQRTHPPLIEQRGGSGFVVGPVTSAEWLPWGPIGIRLELALDTFLVRTEAEGFQTPVALRAGLGLGLSM